MLRYIYQYCALCLGYSCPFFSHKKKLKSSKTRLYLLQTLWRTKLTPIKIEQKFSRWDTNNKLPPISKFHLHHVNINGIDIWSSFIFFILVLMGSNRWFIKKRDVMFFIVSLAKLTFLYSLICEVLRGGRGGIFLPVNDTVLLYPSWPM